MFNSEGKYLPTSKLFLGYEFFDSPEENHKRALAMWLRSSAQGYPQGKIKVGDYHYYGHGTPVDYPLAAAYYQLADQDHVAQAMFNLGFMHEYGIGLDKDLHLAKRFYDKAIETSAEAAVPANLALMSVLTKMRLQVPLKKKDMHMVFVLTHLFWSVEIVWVDLQGRHGS